MRYASKRTYGGQRASVGRTVVVNTKENGLGVGLIDGIGGDDECVWIYEVGSDDAGSGLVFHDTQTGTEIETMPVGCWTWPVRV